MAVGSGELMKALKARKVLAKLMIGCVKAGREQGAGVKHMHAVIIHVCLCREGCGPMCVREGRRRLWRCAIP